MEYDPGKPTNKKFLTTEITVALIGGLAILIAAIISVWGTLTATQVPISATQTAEAKLTQIALGILASPTATPASSRTSSSAFTATTLTTSPNLLTLTITFTPKPSEMPHPTATFVPKSTGTPRPTADPSLKIGSAKVSQLDGATMMYVPAGDFLMGSSDLDVSAQDDEKPQHMVSLDAFWIDKFEVTNVLYRKCVDARTCLPPREIRSNTRNSYYGNSQYNNHPVIYVTWDDANTFCSWAKKRLPTEAEWEKASRGTDGRFYPWGNIFDVGKVYSSSQRQGDTIAVGSYPSGASPYGTMDMSGNVWEWIADWYDPNYYSNSPRNNSKGPPVGQYHGGRGGSWDSSSSLIRVANRNSNYIDRDNNLGFRCAE